MCPHSIPLWWISMNFGSPASNPDTGMNTEFHSAAFEPTHVSFSLCKATRKLFMWCDSVSALLAWTPDCSYSKWSISQPVIVLGHGISHHSQDWLVPFVHVQWSTCHDYKILWSNNNYSYDHNNNYRGRPFVCEGDLINLLF